MDEIMRVVQGASEKSSAVRFCSLSVRVGVAGIVKFFGKILLGKRTYDLKDTFVAKVIEFYVPAKFAQRVKWLPPQARGRVIEFRLPTKKSA